jgi:hypothetical protein
MILENLQKFSEFLSSGRYSKMIADFRSGKAIRGSGNGSMYRSSRRISRDDNVGNKRYFLTDSGEVDHVDEIEGSRTQRSDARGQVGQPTLVIKV